MTRDIITPGAFDKAIERAAGKVVPLVVYEDGARRVVGEAFIHEDGTIDAKIAEEIELPEALKTGMVIGASLGPFQAPRIIDQVHPHSISLDNDGLGEILSVTPVTKED